MMDLTSAEYVQHIARRIEAVVKATGGAAGIYLDNLRFEPAALDVLFEQARGLPALIHDGAEDCLKAQPKGLIAASNVADAFDRDAVV